MADCYFHGYSGGPGACDLCEQERREGKEQGDITRPLDARFTMEEVDGLWHKRAGLKPPKKRSPEADKPKRSA